MHTPLVTRMHKSGLGTRMSEKLKNCVDLANISGFEAASSAHQKVCPQPPRVTGRTSNSSQMVQSIETEAHLHADERPGAPPAPASAPSSATFAVLSGIKRDM